MFAHRTHRSLQDHTNLETRQRRRACARKKSNLLRNRALENPPRKVSAVSHVPQDRGDPDLLASWKIWRKLLEHATLWHRANDFVLQLTIGEQQHGGNTHDVVTTSDVAVVINV